MDIIISDEIKSRVPQLKVIVVEAKINNGPTPDGLWDEIAAACEKVRATFAMDMINKRPAIAGTRSAYKALGKEPNRYRPSAEALCRRCVKGLELYRSMAAVDLINLISILSGHSIGGFDCDAIEGGALILGVGRDGEPYEAIGRGMLNIAGLPVFRDAVGGVGTPTSDNDRTKLTERTSALLMTINMYGPSEMSADDVVNLTRRLLETYAEACDIKVYEARFEGC